MYIRRFARRTSRSPYKNGVPLILFGPCRTPASERDGSSSISIKSVRRFLRWDRACLGAASLDFYSVGINCKWKMSPPTKSWGIKWRGAIARSPIIPISGDHLASIPNPYLFAKYHDYFDRVSGANISADASSEEILARTVTAPLLTRKIPGDQQPPVLARTEYFQLHGICGVRRI